MRAREGLLEGRPHYVVPVVMIVEGVLNGSHGPIYYGTNELKKSVPLWNGRPCCVYHPGMLRSGGYVGNPDVFNKQKVGYVFNVRVSGKRLLAEAWLDKERLRHVDPRVAQAVRSGRMMEV